MAKKFSDVDKVALHRLYGLGEVIAKQRPDVPPTRDELESLGITKKNLQSLERHGLVHAKTMIVTQTYRNGSRTTSGRVTYTLTPLGREVCDQLGFVKPKDEPQVLPPENQTPVTTPEPSSGEPTSV